LAEVARIGARQSMDGKGCWRESVFVERLRCSVKYEEMYLKAYYSVIAARQGRRPTSTPTTADGHTKATTGARRT
jgi:hypothetical protein